jgi:hypothetical protein
MVPHITTILQRFTGEWAMLLQPDAILTVCREIGYTAWRDRLLTPVTTMQLFLLQILHGNTACSHLPHLSGLRFTAAAYCQARARLPIRFFDLLLERFNNAVQRSALDGGRWQGHRTFLVDGSGCSMPDTPALQETFGQPTVQRESHTHPFPPMRRWAPPGASGTVPSVGRGAGRYFSQVEEGPIHTKVCPSPLRNFHEEAIHTSQRPTSKTPEAYLVCRPHHLPALRCTV